MRAMKNAYENVVQKPEGKRHSQDLGIDERIISDWCMDG
jgi:hypothetical protein